MSKPTRARHLLAVSCLVLLGVLSSGCQHRYVANRVHDLADIVQVGAGFTHENPESGIIPPAYGVYAQCTDFINLGAIYFNGVTAELDGRATFVGQEERLRYGIGPLQMLKIDQDVDGGKINYFKRVNGGWTKRMNTQAMRWWEKPAKELEYEYWADTLHVGSPIMHRGWHYWENIALEVAVPCPFISHFGFIGKIGFDPSEISDFLLGIATVDFKKDDLLPSEYEEFYGQLGYDKPAYAAKPASD